MKTENTFETYTPQDVYFQAETNIFDLLFETHIPFVVCVSDTWLKGTKKSQKTITGREYAVLIPAYLSDYFRQNGHTVEFRRTCVGSFFDEEGKERPLVVPKGLDHNKVSHKVLNDWELYCFKSHLLEYQMVCSDDNNVIYKLPNIRFEDYL